MINRVNTPILIFCSTLLLMLASFRVASSDLVTAEPQVKSVNIAYAASDPLSDGNDAQLTFAEFNYSARYVVYRFIPTLILKPVKVTQNTLSIRAPPY